MGSVLGVCMKSEDDDDEPRIKSKVKGKKKSHFSYEKVLDRWFSLSSATLAGAASNCIQSSLPAQDQQTLDGAMIYTIVLLVVFVVMGAVFFKYKKDLESSATDEEKDDLTGLTPTEVLELTVDEGIQNFTAAIAVILATVWYGFATVKGFELICWTFVIGVFILLLGEWIQLELKKGGMAEYIWGLLNGLNQGNVAWFIGLSMSNYTEHRLGLNNTSKAYLLSYWHWCLGLIIGLVLLEIFTFLSSKLPMKADSKPYGAFVFGMLKAIPMYSSGWILNDVVQYRWNNAYVEGTMVWCFMSAVLVVFFDQVQHQRSLSTCFGIVPHDDAKFVYHMTKDAVNLLQQTFAFICGNMAGFIDLPFTDTIIGWYVWAVIFQAAGFAVQGARTYWLPKAFKVVQAREAYLTNGDYISLTGA